MPEKLGKPFVILGCSGHAKVVIDLLEVLGCTVLGVADRIVSNQQMDLFGKDLLGDDQKIMEMNPNDVYLAMGVGSVGVAQPRTALYRKFISNKFVFPPLIHPASIVSSYAEISNGSQIMAGAVVQASARIGSNCIINTQASIDHDCEIGDDVHIAPGAILSGGVSIGNDVHVGTAAHIIQSINIGRGAIVGAGVTVLKDVPNGTKLRACDASVWNG